MAAATCLAALGCLALALEFDARTHAQPTNASLRPAPIASEALVANVGTSSALNGAGMGSLALLSQVRASARQLYRSVRGEVPARAPGR